MSPNLAGHIVFPQSVWRNFLVWFWLPIFFFSKNYRNIGIWSVKKHFFKLSDYQNIEYWAAKLGKLSDIWYQTLTIGLSEKKTKTIDRPALQDTYSCRIQQFLLFSANKIWKRQTSICLLQTETQNGSLFSLAGKR